MSRHQTHLKNITKMQKIGFKLVITNVWCGAFNREFNLPLDRGFLRVVDDNGRINYLIGVRSPAYYPIRFNNDSTGEVLEFRTWKDVGIYIHNNNI